MATRKETEQNSIFISYGREVDVSYFVRQLKRDLEANGYAVWLDMESIPSGSDWHGAIGTGLQECSAIIPIITQKYVSSRFCMNELYTADGDKKAIFPIMYEDVDFVSRFFAPSVGVPEDPVTGSAHTVLTPFWSKRLKKKTLEAKQLSKRGGELICIQKGERVEIGGKAITYLIGDIHI